METHKGNGLETDKLEAIVSDVLQEFAKKLHPCRQQNETVKQDIGGSPVLFPEGKEFGVGHPNNREAIERARQITPARIGIGRAGTRMRTTSYLQFRIDHAAAQDAVLQDVSPEFLTELQLPVLETRTDDLQAYLMDPDLGRRLKPESAEWLDKHAEKGKNVQVIVCDGLSSSAVEANINDLLPSLMQGLKLKNISTGRPVFIRRARVWVQDHVAAIVDCDVVVSLIGERPGLATAESISAYMIYRPGEHTVEADRTVISNIHRGGLSPVEAGAHLADIIAEMLKRKASGVAFAKQRGT
ncbi:ethanolamine ammonia-lyase subunit EutC [Aneurinibacillus terranovensis]|uniref:ethanolamine ammonia-lyase subunit EutC n=1 Tax=Aneurinibacillus terranovensis TaxID=278991 RepID=UPI0004107E86|nr:ethanolamine ammonia-lyase subunit EutC [Aneurinibacillus terranovensis]